MLSKLMESGRATWQHDFRTKSSGSGNYTKSSMSHDRRAKLPKATGDTALGGAVESSHDRVSKRSLAVTPQRPRAPRPLQISGPTKVRRHLTVSTTPPLGQSQKRPTTNMRNSLRSFESIHSVDSVGVAVWKLVGLLLV